MFWRKKNKSKASSEKAGKEDKRDSRKALRGSDFLALNGKPIFPPGETEGILKIERELELKRECG